MNKLLKNGKGSKASLNKGQHKSNKSLDYRNENVHQFSQEDDNDNDNHYLEEIEEVTGRNGKRQ